MQGYAITNVLGSLLYIMACASVLLSPWILSVKMWCGKHIEIPDADTAIFFIPRMSIISVMLDDGKAHTLPLSYAHIACQLPNCVSHGEARDTLIIANHQHIVLVCWSEGGADAATNTTNCYLSTKGSKIIHAAQLQSGTLSIQT